MINTQYPCPLCNNLQSQLQIASAVQMQQSNKVFNFNRCLSCSLIFLFNPPSENELNHYYNSNYLPYLGIDSFGKYRKFVNLGQMSIDKKRVEIVLKNYKNITEDSTILDFGCGNPSFIHLLQNKTQAKCVGYDLFPHGWENKSFNNKNIQLISGDLETLNTGIKYDLVTMWHTLEHEFQPNNLIQFLNKITKDDATLIIEVPNYDSITRKIQKSFWAGYHTPRHSVVFTPKTLIKVMKKNGWTARKIKIYGTLPAFTLWWLGFFEKKMSRKPSYAVSLENYFWNFVILKIALFPIFFFEKFFSFGLMTVVFKKTKNAT